MTTPIKKFLTRYMDSGSASAYILQSKVPSLFSGTIVQFFMRIYKVSKTGIAKLFPLQQAEAYQVESHISKLDFSRDFLKLKIKETEDMTVYDYDLCPKVIQSRFDKLMKLMESL